MCASAAKRVSLLLSPDLVEFVTGTGLCMCRAEVAAKRAKNVDDLTLEKAKVEMEDPGFRGHKNKPIADSSQGSPNSTGTPGRVYKQLNLIEDLGEDLGNTTYNSHTYIA